MLRRPASLALLVLDGAMAAGAMALAYFLRFGLQMSEAHATQLAVSTAVFAALALATFPAFGMYVAHWRYPTLVDLVRIPRAVVALACLQVVAMFFVIEYEGMSRLAIVIATFVLLNLIFASRFCFRLDEAIGATRARERQDPALPVLLVGAGRAADDFIRTLSRDPEHDYRPVGLLASDGRQIGVTVRGVPVLGALRDAGRVIAELALRGERPRHLFFTEQVSDFGDDGTALVELADRAGIAVSRLPRASELRRPLDGVRDLRPIELSDLLERPQAVFDRAAVAEFVKGRRVLVTGAGGSIGGEMSLQLAAFAPAELVLLDNCEFNLYSIEMAVAEAAPRVARRALLCDVRDAERVRAVFRRHRPELVFHAAALKHVPLVELNPVEGALTNVVGSRNVADAARTFGARAMVQVSTDKAVNSTSVMGATKRLAELYCQALDTSGVDRAATATRFMTVRFGNVLGSSGSLIPLFQRQIAAGGPLTVTDENMTRFFMTIREAVQLTLQAATKGLERSEGRGDIFVLDMGKPIRIMDIARRMIRLTGLRPDRDIAIRIIGARPGEKLFEELFDDAEERLASDIPGVNRARSTPDTPEALADAIGAIEAAARAGDARQVLQRLARAVRGYAPAETPQRADAKSAADAPSEAA